MMGVQSQNVRLALIAVDAVLSAISAISGCRATSDACAGRSFGRYAVHPTFHGQAQIAHPQAQQVIQQYDGHIAPAAAPWVAYGHYPAPSLSAYPPAPYSYGPYTAAGPAASSFAQSMPPSGTLPFTMGSEPRESARGTRRAQVAATAMIPARYRVRRAQRRE